MYKVAVALVDRANYGRLKPVMAALKERGEVELLTICSGTMLLDRFGRARAAASRQRLILAVRRGKSHLLGTQEPTK